MKRLLFVFLMVAGCNACTTIVRPINVNPGKVTADTTIRHNTKLGKPDSTGFLKITDAPLGKGLIMRYGYIDPYFRDSLLAKRWIPRVQTERGYCVTSWSVLVQDNASSPAIMTLDLTIDSTFIVWEMQPAHAEDSTASSIWFNCPYGMPRAHVHPPNTCKDDRDLSTCVSGGFSGYQCQPSDKDILNIMYYGAPFGINICGPNQVRFYYPSDIIAHRWSGPRAKTDTLPNPRFVR
jgi:hypothetical protein